MATFILGGFWHGAGWTFLFWGFLHGLSLAIHRLWQTLGFKMWTWLAWLITFNFVNIAWVFFRAKEWDDALRILSSMFSLDNIVIDMKFKEKLIFLENYGIEFNRVTENLEGGSDIINFLIMSFLIVLLSKNSMEFKNNFKSDILRLLFTTFLFIYSIFYFNRFSEFLYFNF